MDEKLKRIRELINTKEETDKELAELIAGGELQAAPKAKRGRPPKPDKDKSNGAGDAGDGAGDHGEEQPML